MQERAGVKNTCAEAVTTKELRVTHALCHKIHRRICDRPVTVPGMTGYVGMAAMRSCVAVAA